jgi:hypothetical protein
MKKAIIFVCTVFFFFLNGCTRQEKTLSVLLPKTNGQQHIVLNTEYTGNKYLWYLHTFPKKYATDMDTIYFDKKDSICVVYDLETTSYHLIDAVLLYITLPPGKLDMFIEDYVHELSKEGWKRVFRQEDFCFILLNKDQAEVILHEKSIEQAKSKVDKSGLIKVMIKISLPLSYRSNFSMIFKDYFYSIF